jgi:hypothetical protein
MTTGSGGPWSALRHAARSLRRQGVAAVAMTVLGVIPATLLVAWGLGDGWPARSAGPILLVGGAVVTMAALALVLGRRWVVSVTEDAVASAVERGRGLADGSLRGVLELRRGLPPGASPALFRQRERDLATRLGGLLEAELVGGLGEAARRRRAAVGLVAGAVALLVVGAGFASPERAAAGWQPLLHPVSHLRGDALPALAVEPGNVEVPRGEMLEVRVSAPARSRVAVEWQAVGDVPRQRRLPVVDGRGATALGPIDDVVVYRVRAPDGATTATFRAVPADPLLLTALTLELVFPEHVGRAPERLHGGPGALAVPEGTRIRLLGRATRTLGEAVLQGAAGDARVATTAGDTFTLDWRPDRSATGLWEIHLRDVTGTRAVAGLLDLQVVPDAAPLVRILSPGADTILHPSRRQALVVEAADDHGLVAVELVHRRLGARGERGPATRTPLPVEVGVDRAVIRGVLDASTEPLLPGDAVEYHVAVRDNAPGGQVGRSATYLLHLPGLAQLRDRARSESADLVQALRDAVRDSRAVAREARDLRRRHASGGDARLAASGGDRAAGSGSLDHRRAAEARQLAATHEESLARLEAMERQLERLAASVTEAGLGDLELQRRLDQLRELHSELAAAERSGDGELLRSAAEGLDPDGLAAALERLADRQDELRERLEEALALLEAAALEQELQALAREAEEIAGTQEVLAAAIREELGAGTGDPGTTDSAGRDGVATDEEESPTPGDPSGDEGDEAADEAPGEGGDEGAGDAAARRATEQDELAERTRRLSDLLSALQPQLVARGDPEAASQAGAAQEQASSARGSMEDAAEHARQGEGDESARSGEEAAGAMAGAAASLDEARRRMAQSGRQAVAEAVQQATQDALRLAEREEALRQQMAAAQGGGAGGDRGEALQQIQSEQAAVRQGLEQLGRNLSEATRSTGAMDRDVAQALARAMLDMDRTMEGLGSGTMPVRQAERTVESLNRLARALLEQDMRGQARAGGVEQAMERLGDAARDQGALNARAAAFVPMDLPSTIRAEQVRQMAEEQHGIARRVGEISGLLGGQDDGVGRLDHLAAEAAAIAVELEGGRLDPEVRARQDRLFHRLLDAGRTLTGDEQTDERVGERPARVAVVAPDGLDPALLEGRLRYPVPTAEQLRELPAAYRRLIQEYFDRINRSEGRP